MKKRVLVLFSSLFLIGCNNGNVDMPKSPFKDSYNRIGMNSEYQITSSLNNDEYDKLKTAIKNYKDIDDTVRKYTRAEEVRDLKAAYFGKNIGAANLCRLISKNTIKYRYDNLVTIEETKEANQTQVANGEIISNSQTMSDYIFESSTDHYRKTRSQKINDEPVSEIEVIPSTEYTDINETFGIKPYLGDIIQNFGEKEIRKEKIIFNVLDDVNNAVYGKDKEGKLIIKEAKSLFVPYSTTVGDTVKAVDNFFYEAKLEQVENKVRFTNFRYYHEMLILSEPYGDESKVPVLYLEKPQLVEFSEIRYTIDSYNSIGNYEGYIPKK